MKFKWLILLLALPFSGMTQPADSSATLILLDSLLSRCQSLNAAGKYAEALPVAQQALDLSLPVLGEKHVKIALVWNQMGSSYFLSGNYSQAADCFRQVARLRGELFGKDHPDYASGLNNIGISLLNLGHFADAEPLILEAKNIREKALGRESRNYGASLLNLATLYHSWGKLEQVEALYLESIEILERIMGSDHPDYAQSLNNLAAFYEETGRFEAAEQIFLRVLKIRAAALGEHHPDYGTTLYNLANLYQDMGRFPSAEKLFLEAQRHLAISIGKEHPDYAASLNNLANFYHNTGRFEEARSLHSEALELREKLFGKDNFDYLSSLQNLADVNQSTGAIDTAEIQYEAVLQGMYALVGKQHPRYAAALSDQAILYSEMGHYDRAEPLFKEVNKLWKQLLGTEHPAYARSLHNLGVLYRKSGRLAEAETVLLQALQIREKILPPRHPEYIASLHQLALLYASMGNTDALKQYAHRASEARRFLQGEGMAYLSEKELTAFSREFMKDRSGFLSIATLHQSFSADITGICYDEELFYKGFLLNATQHIRSQARSDSVSRAMFNKLSSYRYTLAAEYSKPKSQQRDLSELESTCNALEKALSARFASTLETGRQVNWTEVKARLAEHDAAIEFVHFNNRTNQYTDSVLYAALLLRPGWEAPRWVPLFEERQLLPLLEADSSRQKGYVGRLFENADGASLYKLLWQPLEAHLEGVDRIYFAPSGILHRIPLSAIPSAPNQTIGERFALHQLGSTRQLALGSGRWTEARNTDAVIFGGIRYDQGNSAAVVSNAGEQQDTKQRTAMGVSESSAWQYLPWTEVEAKMLDAMFRNAGVASRLYLGDEATEEHFRSLRTGGQSPRVLHIATHGYFYPDPDPEDQKQFTNNPEPVFKISEHPMIRSGLILAGANRVWTGGAPLADLEDGILTAYEVSQMNLSNTELVVLSACDTGLGDIEDNEGVYGLQRAFRIAGARYLLMSLWQVPDFVTQELMTAFYTSWLNEGLPIPDAFRQAQLRIKRNQPDPYFWAGFVLVE